MKTLNIVNNSGSAILVDYSTGDVDAISHSSLEIDWMWIAPEDVEVRYKNKDGKTTVLKAEKNDIIIKFFQYSYTENQVIVVKNNKWKENIIAKKAEEEKMLIEKEAWAAKKGLSCDCCDCKNCFKYSC